MMATIGDEPVMWVNVKSLETRGPYAEKNMEASPAAYGNMIVFGTRGMKIWGVRID